MLLEITKEMQLNLPEGSPPKEICVMDIMEKLQTQVAEQRVPGFTLSDKSDDKKVDERAYESIIDVTTH